MVTLITLIGVPQGQSQFWNRLSLPLWASFIGKRTCFKVRLFSCFVLRTLLFISYYVNTPSIDFVKLFCVITTGPHVPEAYRRGDSGSSALYNKAKLRSNVIREGEDKAFFNPLLLFSTECISSRLSSGILR